VFTTICCYGPKPLLHPKSLGIRSVGASASNFATSVVYQPFGPLASLSYGNGLALSRSYEHNHWLTGISVTDTWGTDTLGGVVKIVNACDFASQRVARTADGGV
jgi:hypothetical protein